MALLYENSVMVSKKQLVLCFKILHDSLLGLYFLHIHSTDDKTPLASAGRLQSALDSFLRTNLAVSQWLPFAGCPVCFVQGL